MQLAYWEFFYKRNSGTNIQINSVYCRKILIFLARILQKAAYVHSKIRNISWDE
jgi:hypothetical protein